MEGDLKGLLCSFGKEVGKRNFEHIMGVYGVMVMAFC